MIRTWDYLIVTASNEDQAAAYREQLSLRRELGLLAEVREVLVVADPGGRRIGSGGSTLHCLVEVLNRALQEPGPQLGDLGSIGGGERLASSAAQLLQNLRVLIVHAGGDSRRLPAYGICGKLFIPVPGEGDSCVPTALFDRQLPTYLALPAPNGGGGQVVVTAGDVLLRFDPQDADFAAEGLTGLGCLAPPDQAAHHGVFSSGPDHRLRRFLQKPSPDEQQALGAVDDCGQAILDIGVTSLTADAAGMMLKVFGLAADPDGRLALAGEMAEATGRLGLDFYREVCCALGDETTPEEYVDAARRAGSAWDERLLRRIFEGLHTVPFRVKVVPRCSFLHLGTSGEVISSGYALLQHDRGTGPLKTVLDVTNEIGGAGRIVGGESWVEGCRVRAPLSLAGENMVVGVDIDQPLELPARACLDVIAGHGSGGGRVWFVRCYALNDTFKTAAADGATFCGRPMLEWLAAVGGEADDVWATDVPRERRTLWNARMFPAETHAEAWRSWLWMFEPARASSPEKTRWRKAERYSLAQMANLADPTAFLRRRLEIRAGQIRASLRRMFRLDSQFSALDLAAILRGEQDPGAWVADLLAEAQWQHDGASRTSQGLESLVFPRIAHTLGSALAQCWRDAQQPVTQALPGLEPLLTEGRRNWLSSMGLEIAPSVTMQAWSERLRETAFQGLGHTILASGGEPPPSPRHALRSDEIVWGRAPARLDLAGGWSDTPPYALEHGGCVVNTAINLNGQPPVQAYARVIRISSIDLGVTIEVHDLETLLDYRRPDSEFALAKAALALSGFSPDAAVWRPGISLPEMLTQFGGGIELTTLAAIPKGSGLGTSSIMGAVTMAVLQRVQGRILSGRELFHSVLRLEQALTTGGGWQDQIGGSVGGAKIIYTQPGVIPDAAIHYLPTDVLDPQLNGGTTLLYYTGITRLAKNILEQVVGRYLDRDRRSMATLRQIHALAPAMAQAFSRKDRPELGRLTTAAWELNKQLDPNSTNAEVEALMARVQPFLHGAKLIGAGGGGFMLMICRSSADAERIRGELAGNPPNPRARFFEFGINPDGLEVTVC